MEKRKTTNLFFNSLFAISIIVLLFIAAVTYRQINELTDSGKWVVHTHELKEELENMFSQVKDAETGQRGFMITNDSAFLEPYTGAREKVYRSFANLKSLTADNPEQQKNLDTLYKQIEARFAFLANSTDLHYSHALPGQIRESLDKGRLAMVNIRSQVNKIVDIENILLQQRKKANEFYISFAPLISLLAIVFSLLVFILSFYRINRDSKSLKKLNDKLLIINNIFENAEELAGMSHWEWNLQTNKLIFSDNYFRLLGHEPRSFEPTIDTLLKFVHPDDREGLKKRSENTFAKGEEGSAYYFRIISIDGKIKYIKAVGKIISGHSGEKILIGSNIDISEQHQNSISLEEKNHELERSNKELESFNYLASHDLQEPLRKILTFISRILEIEGPNLSNTTKDYLARMQSSATRMQKLIDYLLMYSRTNRANQVFEEVDLNAILENTKQELSLVIEEKKAAISSSHLPVIWGIAQQLQQLFINLISNSIKYSRENIPPVIQVKSEIASGTEINGGLIEKPKNYYKISFADNGIGFEQEYADSLFLLFHRLHDKSEYSGSGIGLSICKKIVENHFGEITAEGRPDAGATFTVFLPKEA